MSAFDMKWSVGILNLLLFQSGRNLSGHNRLERSGKIDISHPNQGEYFY